jgi:hypothetical protein
MRRDRTFIDDLRWAVAVFVGFVLGWLVFGADESILLGAAIGIALVVAVRTAVRRYRATGT